VRSVPLAISGVTIASLRDSFRGPWSPRARRMPVVNGRRKYVTTRRGPPPWRASGTPLICLAGSSKPRHCHAASHASRKSTVGILAATLLFSISRANNNTIDEVPCALCLALSPRGCRRRVFVSVHAAVSPRFSTTRNGSFLSRHGAPSPILPSDVLAASFTTGSPRARNPRRVT